jgi:hypothetical protein
VGSDADHQGIARLSRLETAGVLAVAIAVFLLLGGPIWAHRWDPDTSIVYSYVPIPILVFAILLATGRFGLRAFVLESLRITVLKFGLTAGFLTVLWTTQTPPPPDRPLDPLARRTPTPAAARPAEPTAVPAVSTIPAASRGDVTGTVRGVDGSPLASAVVYVTSGLERFVFATEADVPLALTARGLTPDPLVVGTGGSAVIRSGDGRLHTVHAWVGAGDELFNVPLLPSGAERRVRFGKAGAGGIRCDVHPDEAARLLVVAGAFATRTGADGRFRLTGVPAGTIRIAVLGETGPGSARDVAVTAGPPVDGSIDLARPLTPAPARD